MMPQSLVCIKMASCKPSVGRFSKRFEVPKGWNKYQNPLHILIHSWHLNHQNICGFCFDFLNDSVKGTYFLKCILKSFYSWLFGVKHRIFDQAREKKKNVKEKNSVNHEFLVVSNARNWLFIKMRIWVTKRICRNCHNLWRSSGLKSDFTQVFLSTWWSNLKHFIKTYKMQRMV